MGKVLAPIGLLVVVGAVVWALMPVDSSSTKPGKSTAAASTSASTTGHPGEIQDETPGTTKATPTVVPKSTTRVAQPQPAHVQNLRKANPQTPTPTAPTPDSVNPPRVVPQAKASTIKDSVRRFYSNIPKGSPMPRDVRLDDVFDDTIINALNVPPHSKLIEMGSYPATDRGGYEEALKLSGKYQSTFGVGVKTPDGRKIRDYITVLPD